MASRDPERERQWREWLTEWHRSKLSVYAFCNARNLQKTTFYWHKNHAYLRAASPPATFVQMMLVPEPMVEIRKCPVNVARDIVNRKADQNARQKIMGTLGHASY